ncbi:hypothetical protein [Bacillus thuringiensis]|uniref:hypothetical protein n=1 Tax=Bacillus thuringiensis TaxID=1428 RepID=UPI00114520A3|nr:hypothetical protein [Bacillus thuringiensis]
MTGRELALHKQVNGFPTFNKVLYLLTTTAGIGMLLAGSRISTFMLFTGFLMLGLPFLFTERTDKAQSNKKVRKPWVQRLLTGLTAGILLILLYDFSFYTTLFVQIQAEYNGYTTIHQVENKEDFSGLLLTHEPKSGAPVTFYTSGWKLER